MPVNPYQGLQDYARGYLTKTTGKVPGGPSGSYQSNKNPYQGLANYARGFQAASKKTTTKVGNTTTTTTSQPGQAPQPTAPQPVTPDPRDAQYFENMAKLDFQRKNRIDDLNAQGANDQANTTYRLGQLANQHPTDIRNERVAFNRKGLFESGQLGQGLGELETKYAATRGQVNTALAQRSDARSRSMAQANQGYLLGSDSELNAARGRAAKAVLANPPDLSQDPYARAIVQALTAKQQGKAPAGKPAAKAAPKPVVPSGGRVLSKDKVKQPIDKLKVPVRRGWTVG